MDTGPDMVVRPPRRPNAAAGVLREVETLQRLEAAGGSVIVAPRVRHVGRPHEVFPHHWSILEWIEGRDAWALRDDLSDRSLRSLFGDLAEAVTEIGRLDADGIERRQPGSRGGPLRPLLARIDGWLDSPEWNAADLLDVGAVRRVAAEALDIVDEPVIECFVHGDLIPGNLLISLDGYPPYLPDRDFARFLSSPFAIGAWVATCDAVVAGHVSLHTRAAPAPAAVALATERLGIDAWQIGVVARLLVDPERRRTGVARSLLDVAGAEAERRGLVAILDVVDRFESAIRLYEREGWTRLGTVTVDLPDGTSLDERVYSAPRTASRGVRSRTPVSPAE